MIPFMELPDVKLPWAAKALAGTVALHILVCAWRSRDPAASTLPLVTIEKTAGVEVEVPVEVIKGVVGELPMEAERVMTRKFPI